MFSVLKHEKVEIGRGKRKFVGCGDLQERQEMERSKKVGKMERSKLMVGCRNKLLELSRDFNYFGWTFFSFIFNFYLVSEKEHRKVIIFEMHPCKRKKSIKIASNNKAFP